MSEEVVAETFEAQLNAAIADAEAAEADGDSEETEEQQESSEDAVVSGDGETEEQQESSEEEEEPKGKPHVSEWVKLRQAKAKLREKQAQAEARVNELAEQATTRLAPYQAIADAIASGDWDEFAKVAAKAAGLEADGWNGLNKLVARKYTSPEYSEVQKLRRQQEQLQRELQEKQLREQTQAQQARQQQAQREYVEQLTETLRASDDPSTVAAADNPTFVRAVFNAQAAAYDASTGETISTEEAVAEVKKQARAEYERLSKIFGDRAPNPESRQPRPRKASNGRTISTRSSVQAKPSGAMSESENFELAVREMEAAMDA